MRQLSEVKNGDPLLGEYSVNGNVVDVRVKIFAVINGEPCPEFDDHFDGCDVNESAAREMSDWIALRFAE